MTINQVPSTRRDNIVENLNGVEISDSYRWLEDQDCAETRSWLEAQIEYTHKTLASYSGREKIRNRLTELMKVDTTSQPVCRNGAYFFIRRRADEQQFVVYRRRSLTGTDEVLIDPHPMSPDRTTSVTLLDVSHDASLIAYGIRQGGADEVEIHVRNADTFEDLPDALPAGRYYGVEIAPDNTGFYYSVSTLDGPRVRLHRFGERSDLDEEIFGSSLGTEKIVGIRLSEDGRYMLISVFHGSAGVQTEVHIADLESDAPVRPLVDTIPARFYAQAAGDTLYLQTNWNAPNGRLLRLSTTATPNSPAEWQEIVPERPNAVLHEWALAGGRLFLNYIENVSSRVVIADADGKPLNDVSLPGLGAVSSPVGRWSNSEIFFAFSSFASPPVVFRYDLDSALRSVWAQSGVTIDADEIEVTQVWYGSKDETRVPMFLVHKKDMPKDGERPVYLTGYGGFNLSRTPAFSALALLWAELGGIYALPNLRGGGEFGEEWHRAGMREKKQNVFDDFYAAAEWLIGSGYTNPNKLGIAGRSNGGLLVGAAITQRPELFGVVVCGYPLLDMVRYHKFLAAPFWVPEYGSSDDPEQLPFLYAYSPYHHVRAGVHYPPIMFVTGDSDTRVAPLHARKMAAVMQANPGSKEPVLLNYDVKSGHSEGNPINQTIEDTTDEVQFMWCSLGGQDFG